MQNALLISWNGKDPQQESERIISAFKRVKIYFRSNVKHNQLHALIPMQVHKNIRVNINLADVVNELIDIKDNRKQTFGHFSIIH